jgi:AAA domain-containing protein
VAAGGKAFGALEVEQGDVLYLSLEDDPQGLQERVDAIWEDDEHDVPSNLYIQHEEVPKLGTGLVESLTTWLLHHPTARLILIDILADIRPPRKANGDWYLEDKALLSPLRALAHRFHVAIVLLHHTNRLSNSENPFEMIHGGAGIEGTPDVKAVLLRGVGQSDAILAIRGRSIREQKAAFRYAEGLWTYVGDGQDFERSRERQDILTYLRATPDAVTPKHVAIMLGRPEGPTRKLIRAMARHGEVKRVAYGLYTVFRNPSLLAESPPTIGNSGNSEHSGHSGNSGNSAENSMAYDSADGGGSDDSPAAADARVTRVTAGENTGNSSNELIPQEKTSEISQELPELPESLGVGLGHDRGGERARPSRNGRGSPPSPGNRRSRGNHRGGWTWPDPDDRRRGREP